MRKTAWSALMVFGLQPACMRQQQPEPTCTKNTITKICIKLSTTEQRNDCALARAQSCGIEGWPRKYERKPTHHEELAALREQMKRDRVEAEQRALEEEAVAPEPQSISDRRAELGLPPLPTSSPAEEKERPPEEIDHYSWHDTITDKTSDGCEHLQSEQLYVAISNGNQVEWAGHTVAVSTCPGDEHNNVSPTSCWRGGKGELTPSGAGDELQFTPTSYGGAPGPVASTASVWMCGSMKLELPLDWQPVTSGFNSCKRIGSATSVRDEAVAQFVCQAAKIFSEFKAMATVVSMGDDVEFRFQSKSHKLTRSSRVN